MPHVPGSYLHKHKQWKVCPKRVCPKKMESVSKEKGKCVQRKRKVCPKKCKTMDKFL